MRGTSFEKDLIRDFWLAVNDLDSHERLYFLDKLLTPTEKLMLAKRLAILEELGKGTNYETIAERYKVITNTIGRMSNILRSSSKLLPVLSKIDAARWQRGKKKSPPVRSVAGSRTMAGTKRILGL